MSAATIALILTWVGIIAGIICTAILCYITSGHKTFLGLDKDDYVGFMISICILFALAMIFDFDKYTVFNFNVWLVNALLWDKTRE
jgi:hypothetical protein